jgi:predicted lipoprotein with Yx(FWY)xxD motif
MGSPYRGRGSAKRDRETDEDRGLLGHHAERMNRFRSLKIICATVVAFVALVAAGCGDDDNGDSGGSPPASNAGTATVDLADTGLGKVLVDSKGRTLYLFQADKGTTSECSGACADEWPPVRDSGKPTVGDGLKASLVGTTKRSDGAPEVTYGGHPLYTYVGDEDPGDTNGQGINAFGGLWYAVTASGDQASGPSGGSGANGY